MSLLCPIWAYSVPYETPLSHMRLLCTMWDCSVPYEYALSYMRLLCPLWELCPKWDCSDQFETVMSQMRLTFSSHMRLLCLMWHWSIKHLIANLPPLDFYLLGTDLSFLGLKLGTRLGHKQDWDNHRNDFLRYFEEIQAKTAYWLYKPPIVP